MTARTNPPKRWCRLVDNLQRPIGVFARFHVNLYPAAHRTRLLNQRDDIVHAGLIGEIETKLRQLDRDRRLQLVHADRFERFEIRLARLRRFLQRSDVLTQAIERSGDVLLLQLVENPDAFFE